VWMLAGLGKERCGSSSLKNENYLKD
jgi:hypothetical protein